MSGSSRRRAGGLLAGLAALALVGSTVAGVGGSSAAGSPEPQVAPVTHPDTVTHAALGAFRRPAQQGDLVPLGVRSALAASQGVADVNPELARAVGPGGRLYLMPGDGQLCVGRDLDAGSVVYCATDEALVQDQFVGAVVHKADGFDVSGIAGDGASAARVTTVRGTVDADVVGGAVLTTTDAPPVSISWVDRGGERHTQAIGVGR